MKRILTLQVEITDREKASWIWENNSGKDTGNGIHVMSLMEGKICDMRDNDDEEE